MDTTTRMKELAVALAATVVAACGHQLALTAGGTRVERVERSHLPDDCRLVGDVSIGIPPDAALAATEAELVILMRNKAGEMGGDHVIVEQSELRPAEGGGVGHWVGSGAAYVCAPVTTGGEAPAHDLDEASPPTVP